MNPNGFLWIVLTAGAALADGYWLWQGASSGDIVITRAIEADDIHIGSKLGGCVLKVVAKEG
jgi:hypothetical protein